jgi:hypothetical protein
LHYLRLAILVHFLDVPTHVDRLARAHFGLF